MDGGRDAALAAGTYVLRTAHVYSTGTVQYRQKRYIKYSDLSGQESEAEGNSSAPKRAEASEKI